MPNRITTGTCAAACTRGRRCCFSARGKHLRRQNSDTFRRPGDSADCRAEREEDSAVCGVQKDSGDDPDVTNGTLVCARAVLACHDSITESGYTDPAYPGIEVTGGEGIGMVTQTDGLSCPVGHY
ncbi:MAG: cobalt-precorrin-5B (C(1))-methyltransferase [Clostridium fessum]